jgi:hypothetical protein
MALVGYAQAQAQAVPRMVWFQTTVQPMTRYFCTTDNPFRRIYREPEVECATTVVILMKRCFDQAVRESRMPLTLNSAAEGTRAGEQMGVCVYLTYKTELQAVPPTSGADKKAPE